MNMVAAGAAAAAGAQVYYDCLMKPNSKSVVTALRKVSPGAADVSSSSSSAALGTRAASSDFSKQELFSLRGAVLVEVPRSNMLRNPLLRGGGLRAGAP